MVSRLRSRDLWCARERRSQLPVPSVSSTTDQWFNGSSSHRSWFPFLQEKVCKRAWLGREQPPSWVNFHRFRAQKHFEKLQLPWNLRFQLSSWMLICKDFSEPCPSVPLSPCWHKGETWRNGTTAFSNKAALSCCSESKLPIVWRTQFPRFQQHAVTCEDTRWAFLSVSSPCSICGNLKGRGISGSSNDALLFRLSLQTHLETKTNAASDPLDENETISKCDEFGMCVEGLLWRRDTK